MPQKNIDLETKTKTNRAGNLWRIICLLFCSSAPAWAVTEPKIELGGEFSTNALVMPCQKWSEVTANRDQVLSDAANGTNSLLYRNTESATGGVKYTKTFYGNIKFVGTVGKLAIISDDGCTVGVKESGGTATPYTLYINKFLTGQTLNGKAFESVPFQFKPDTLYDVKVDYSQTYYKPKPGQADIDGATLYACMVPAKRLKPIQIEPGDNVAGVVGDLVPSVNGAKGEKHFVAPLKSADIPEIPSEFVELKAVGVTKEEFQESFEWEPVTGGETIPNEPLLYHVKRDTARKIEVKINSKNSGKTAAKINVWIVWATCTQKPGVAEYLPLPETGAKTKARWVVDNSDKQNDPAKLWKFTFQIEPKIIFTDSEVPQLKNTKSKPVPGERNPYTMTPSAGPADTALMQWDVSRRYKVTIRNPDRISKPSLSGIPTLWAKNQPKEEDSPVNFPAETAEGNDDPTVTQNTDEDDNPYAPSKSPTLAHAVGEVTSIDGPRLGVLNLWADGRPISYSCEINFDEFVRVELWDGKRKNGRFWFRISDTTHGLWHHYLNATFEPIDGQWKNRNSKSGAGHPTP